jgi:5'-3' exonuclease
MNQQRARRFKSSQDSVKIHEIEESLAKEHGIKLRDHSFDSNVISPGFFMFKINLKGTEFMDRVSDALKYFINLKITTDKSYKDLKIILSDSSVPGFFK